MESKESPILQGLNPAQRAAVVNYDAPSLIIAGAGSGKTRVLTSRIAYMIEQGVAPFNILALTFTNKAANEMKERLSNLLGSQAQDIWAMTFHSACCRILRRDIERMGFTRSFTIYDSSDSERIMKEIIKDMELDDKTFPAKYVLGAISREKDKMVSPGEMLDRAKRTGDIQAQHIARAYGKYQTRLKDNNALDFDDIIYITVQLLQQNEDVLQYYQRKFRYVLVDEYQDTNHMQYLLTSLLAGGHENICVVGDDDQSIYRFRGATIENILNFEKQYRGARVIRLEQNYRSTQAILTAANAVIAHNLGRKGKKLWTANAQGDPVLVYEASDEGSEGNFVAGQILAGSRGKNFKDYAILYRTNAQSNAMEFALKRNGIPYRVIGGTRFFDRAEVKDMLSYLCVINNRADDLRLGRIINNPPRGLGAKTIETARRLAEAEGKPLYSVISDPYSYAPLEKAAIKMMQFSARIEGMAQLLEDGMSLPDFYDELLIRTGYVKMLKSKDTEENKTRLENVRELKSSINSYVENVETPTLAGFLEEIALYTDLEQYNENDDAVVMMTMHSAKGLEFPAVFVAGMEEGIFPHVHDFGGSDDPGKLEEERRLAYVAITRARKRLFLTYAATRRTYGSTSANPRSRFLNEIPFEDIEFSGIGSAGFEGTGWEKRGDRHGTFGSGMGSDMYGGKVFGSHTRSTGGSGSRGGSSFDDFFGGSSYGTERHRGVSPDAGRVASTFGSGAPRAKKPSSKVSPTVERKVNRASASQDFAAGDTVSHKTFGTGTVISVVGDMIEVQFEKTGQTKKLMKGFAPIVKLS